MQRSQTCWYLQYEFSILHLLVPISKQTSFFFNLFVLLRCFRDGPLLVVASGRDTISVASSIKRLASEKVFLVQV